MLLFRREKNDTCSGKNALLKFTHSWFVNSQEENSVLLRWSPVTYPVDRATPRTLLCSESPLRSNFSELKTNRMSQQIFPKLEVSSKGQN